MTTSGKITTLLGFVAAICLLLIVLPVFTGAGIGLLTGSENIVGGTMIGLLFGTILASTLLLYYLWKY